MWPFNRISRIEGRKCYIVVDENGKRTMVQGNLITQWKDAVKIRYLWLNDVFHSFITLEKDVRFWHEDCPVFSHNIGHLFGENSGLALSQEISSEYYDQISNCDLGSRMIQSMESWDKSVIGINWKLVMIIAAVVIGGFLLWKSGIIESLIKSITG